LPAGGPTHERIVLTGSCGPGETWAKQTTAHGAQAHTYLFNLQLSAVPRRRCCRGRTQLVRGASVGNCRSISTAHRALSGKPDGTAAAVERRDRRTDTRPLHTRVVATAGTGPRQTILPDCRLDRHVHWQARRQRGGVRWVRTHPPPQISKT